MGEVIKMERRLKQSPPPNGEQRKEQNGMPFICAYCKRDNHYQLFDSGKVRCAYCDTPIKNLRVIEVTP
jgi:hypothetical protein